MVSILDIFLQKPRSDLPLTAEACTESPEKAAIRLAQIERQMRDVGCKIEKVYGISVRLDDKKHSIAHHVGENVAKFWCNFKDNRKWLNDHPHLEVPISKAIEESATEYFTAFFLFKTLKSTPQAEENYAPYEDPRAAELLYQIYANHVCNAAEARLIAAGVDPIKAHRINGGIIRSTIDIAHETISKDIFIDPAQTRPRNEVEAVRQIKRLRSYKQCCANELSSIVQPTQR